MYASIIVDISIENLDRPFSYRVPKRLEEKCHPGTKVMVPFGKGNRLITGFILELVESIAFDESKVKDIADVVVEQSDKDGRLIELAAYIKEQYGSTMNVALKTVLPVKQNYKPKEKKTISLKCDIETAREAYAEAVRKRQVAKIRILKELLNDDVLEYSLVREKLNVSMATLNSLEAAGIIRIEVQDYFRNPVVIEHSKEQDIELNEMQQSIVDDFVKDYKAGERHTYLLHGITGSGKTVTYIKLIQNVVDMGKQVIVLIPEIALTYQTVKRFYHYFGDRVSVLNSSLSAGEKYDQCQRAKNGEIDIIIGPRSALFVPFNDVGLIVIDEEHEHTYKSENMPKYHAREVAIELARLHNASVVLGSATPDVESYYKAKAGEYKLWKLCSRAKGEKLPDTHIIDMKEELKNGNKSIFARDLVTAMNDRLNKGEQIMLFLNRRGYSGFVSCRSCGVVMRCPHCDVSLSEHQSIGRLVCHYCGYEETRHKLCPKCGSKYLLGFKAGTEQIEEEVKKIFPKARTLRMDADTTSRKGSMEKILSDFSEKKADVLIGTQMIVKGHDFPDVTLVGIVAADMSLAVNDYKAGERTFQLITQAAGRAGRGEKAGETFIQTYQPDNYAIVWAAKQDYEAFYEEEILYRDLSGYPPVKNILAVMLTGKDKNRGLNMAQQMVNILKCANIEDVVIIGPAKAGIGKINDLYRFVFYLKCDDRQMLTRCKDILEEETKDEKYIKIYYDFNPMNAY